MDEKMARMRQLVDRLKETSYAYYVLDHPVMSSLLMMLRSLQISRMAFIIPTQKAAQEMQNRRLLVLSYWLN